MNITIGVSTYGTLPMAERFIKNMWPHIESQFDVKMVMVDDGTPDKPVVTERAKFCQKWNTQFIAHGVNRGISDTWNTILNTAVENKSELCVIFNSDIRALMPGFLPRLAYFFKNNENIGGVGLPLLQEPLYDENDPRWDQSPGLVGAAVGCSFAMRPEVALSIENPDGSRGFFSALLSFHEEVDCGLRLAEKSFLSYMLPFPPLWHMGGQTFSTNSELTWRQPCELLSLEEFLKYHRQSPLYYPEYEEKYAEGIVDRMGYSRILAAKYWGVLAEIDAGRRFQEIKGEMVDVLKEPSKFFHALTVDKWPPRLIKWLDKEGRDREAMIG